MINNFYFVFYFLMQVVNNLGPLEYIFVTPKHHRVHHGMINLRMGLHAVDLLKFCTSTNFLCPHKLKIIVKLSNGVSSVTSPGRGLGGRVIPSFFNNRF